MTIHHQTVLDENGNPTAAIIPWDEFRIIKAEMGVPGDAPLSPEWKAELERRMENYRNGTATLIPHEEVMEEVREMCQKLPTSETGE